MAPSNPRDWNAPALRARLLKWYEANQRELPWRQNKDPYSIWVSEIMLQQTRVAVVIDRHRVFLERFPTVDALACAAEEDVLALWSGLGYYRRARMLHQAAIYVAENLNGRMPTTSAELRKLPGIGAYTAAAIASIAHDERVAVVDGNVERVLCRLAGWEASSGSGATALRKKIDGLASELVDPRRPGDFNQGMMELGATVCLPRNPQCLVCPIAEHCVTRGEHKAAPRARMVSREIAHALCVQTRRGEREVLLEQRPASVTVMPGMWELPALGNADVPEEHLRMAVRHAIMQVNYFVRIRDVNEDEVTELAGPAAGKRRWVRADELAGLPLTGLARKVLTRAHLLVAASGSKAAAMLL
ncbi:A/G-specific adenine glycosylase [Occallatibacter riparius]|uniref:Adenine DNA glycosylase n=1 Tax=Occallatibacter riparius TaxID=1002689 RepID=A0A9J7BV14_9BACT|nr:A/G-specific adenine glycosylase [Occallatibacter riparius]UWZ85610.1 A/G-specific adenine glycosylase [Occallatibacter riparius]